MARKIELPLGRVWKTLVARGDLRRVMFAVVPGGGELDLRACSPGQRVPVPVPDWP